MAGRSLNRSAGTWQRGLRAHEAWHQGSDLSRGDRGLRGAAGVVAGLKVRTRREVQATLETDAEGATLYLCTPRREWPVVTSVRRNRDRIFLGLPGGYGITLHRNGGVSIPRFPSSGGTTIAWGHVRHRLRTLGTKRRAIELGPIGIYIGRD